MARGFIITTKIVKSTWIGISQPSEIHHGRKNEYFWKIQKGGARGTPWASKSKKAKDLDQPKINGIAFKKVFKNWAGGVKFGPNPKILIFASVTDFRRFSVVYPGGFDNFSCDYETSCKNLAYEKCINTSITFPWKCTFSLVEV